MAIVISGKDLAKSKKMEMAEEVKAFVQQYGRAPHLAVILVGEDPGSMSYVKGKEKACVEVGFINTTIRKPDTIEESELLEIIDKLNNDASVDGILVQLPLPNHIHSERVIQAIKQDKDVDGFHFANVASLYLKRPGSGACTPNGGRGRLGFMSVR
ncbi:MAG: hypothetical protein K2H06_04725 [Anaeroplasmataceae bacterium]|nr:hypothetical protein [Anaeroplasmataceae bacterium]